MVLGFNQYVLDVGQYRQELITRHFGVVYGRFEVLEIFSHVKPIVLGQSHVTRHVVGRPQVLTAIRDQYVFFRLKTRRFFFYSNMAQIVKIQRVQTKKSSVVFVYFKMIRDEDQTTAVNDSTCPEMEIYIYIEY